MPDSRTVLEDYTSEEDLEEMIIDQADEVGEYVEEMEIQECVNKQYYLGSYISTNPNHLFEHIFNPSDIFINTAVTIDPLLEKWYLIGTRLPVDIILKFPIQNIKSYLYWYSSINMEIPEVHILQAIEINEHENEKFKIWGAVIKTHWLRIIQRTWKRVYKERMKYYGQPKNHYLREIKGKFSAPGLRGMMAIYSNSKSK